MKEKKPLKVVSVDPIEGTIIDYYKKIMENIEKERTKSFPKLKTLKDFEIEYSIQQITFLKK